MTEFADRTVLVTGAAGDIGRAVVELLSERGARVILADLEGVRQKLDEIASTCEQAIVAPFDVTDSAAVVAALAEAVEHAGVLDGVFNNAGYQGEFANTLDYDTEDFDRVFEVNVRGVFNVLKAAARHMAGTNGGSIVNMASMAGVTGAPNMVAYSASKAAVIGMTKSAARDLAPAGIRVNSVSPAFIGPGAMWDRQVDLQANTPSIYFADDPAAVADQMISAVPMRRYGSVDEVAEVVAFLLSDRSSYVTATNTEVAGGAA
ncbi:MAG: SDR family NAD(P)-dependent oxidoreductase [Actinomycetota bacterium]